MADQRGRAARRRRGDADRLALLPGRARGASGAAGGAGFEPDALLATHGDFDHLLGRLAFPGLALGLGEPSVERFHREPGAAQRDLRDYDDKFYVERPSPLALGQVQGLPVPGSVELGSRSSSFIPRTATPPTAWP